MKSFINHNFNIKKIAVACFVPFGSGDAVHKNRPYHGLAFYTEGESIFKFDDGKELLVSPKSIIYLPKNSSYTVMGCNKSAGCYAINFDLFDATLSSPFVVKIKNVNPIADCFKSAESAWRHKSSGYEIKCKAELYRIIYCIIKESYIEYIPNKYAEKIKPAIDYIHHNYTKDNISIAELSNISSMSEVYFRRVFSKVMGISPIKYINNLKITHAKELLETQVYTVSKVAELSGFHDESYFSREFKKNIGICPSEYGKTFNFKRNDVDINVK